MSETNVTLPLAINGESPADFIKHSAQQAAWRKSESERLFGHPGAHISSARAEPSPEGEPRTGCTCSVSLRARGEHNLICPAHPSTFARGSVPLEKPSPEGEPSEKAVRAAEAELESPPAGRSDLEITTDALRAANAIDRPVRPEGEPSEEQITAGTEAHMLHMGNWGDDMRPRCRAIAERILRAAYAIDFPARSTERADAEAVEALRGVMIERLDTGEWSVPIGDDGLEVDSAREALGMLLDSTVLEGRAQERAAVQGGDVEAHARAIYEHEAALASPPEEGE
jgi:hypothetical protein